MPSNFGYYCWQVFPSSARRVVRRQHPTGMTREHARLERGDFDGSNGVGWHRDFGRRRLQASRQLRFSGNVEGKTPQLLSSIIDETKCIISVETPGNSWVYYMKEIKPESVVIDEHNRKISFEGDGTIVEHTFEGLLKIDKENMNSITLRGDIERTKDALKLIFTKYCLPTSG